MDLWAQQFPYKRINFILSFQSWRPIYLGQNQLTASILICVIIQEHLCFGSWFLYKNIDVETATLLIGKRHIKTTYKYTFLVLTFLISYTNFIVCSWALTCKDRIYSAQHSKYHGCWWPGSLLRQDISTHEIDNVEKVSSCLLDDGFQLPVSCQFGGMI